MAPKIGAVRKRFIVNLKNDIFDKRIKLFNIGSERSVSVKLH